MEGPLKGSLHLYIALPNSGKMRPRSGLMKEREPPLGGSPKKARGAFFGQNQHFFNIFNTKLAIFKDFQPVDLKLAGQGPYGPFFGQFVVLTRATHRSRLLGQGPKALVLGWPSHEEAQSRPQRASMGTGVGPWPLEKGPLARAPQA